MQKIIKNLNRRFKINLPKEFSGERYINLNPDLFGIDLEKHWQEFGWKESRPGQFILNRILLKNYLPKKAKYLEIGPLGRPYLKRNEYDVKYFDVVDTKTLQFKAKDQPGHDIEDVPEIDFVDANGSLQNINEKFDIVFSSHCIEHQPNILGHLEQVSKLLKNGGFYICIIPDYRFCFDHFRAPSNIIDVLEAYSDKRIVHTNRNLLLHKYITVHNNPISHWEGDHGYHRLSEVNVKDSLSLLSQSSNDYIDCHAWFFSPIQFREIFITDIKKIMKMDIKYCYETPLNSHEFIAVFEKY